MNRPLTRESIEQGHRDDRWSRAGRDAILALLDRAEQAEAAIIPERAARELLQGVADEAVAECDKLRARAEQAERGCKSLRGELDELRRERDELRARGKGRANMTLILDGMRQAIPAGSELYKFADAIERMSNEHGEMLAMLKSLGASLDDSKAGVEVDDLVCRVEAP
jgi:hypothetical protein